MPLDHEDTTANLGNSAFKSMQTAYTTIKGIEAMRALRKSRTSLWHYGYPLGEIRLVHRAFWF